MYRTPDTTPRCSSCGATELTPPTWLTAADGSLQLVFKVRGAKPGFLGATRKESFGVHYARTCLACGHVMPAIAHSELHQLRARMASLEAYPPWGAQE